MKSIKRFFLIFTCFLFLFPLLAEEEAIISDSDSLSDSDAVSDSISVSDFDSAQDSLSTSSSADFVLQFEPGVYINTESTLVSAPSPIIYPISIGFLWPDKGMFAIQPTISFFMMQHLFYEDKALPAEIENRTTTTLSFMLNIPAVYSIYLQKSNFQLNLGLGLYMRFGLLSPGVKPEDSGWSGSAASDVDEINNYFWGKMRWFYVTAGGSWLYNLTPQLRAGPTINVYLPVGGLVSDKSAQAMIISAGIKICR